MNRCTASLVVGISAFACTTAAAAASTFEGKYFSGTGDIEYLELLDISRRIFEPDPEFQNLPMLYTPAWNGFVEGPTWGAWWIQNSYGPTYCALPFWTEPYTTFIQNSHDLWFDQMGDGQRKGYKDWVAPDGCLCDAASPGWIVYRQGDGKTDIHDWGMEFTAAGVVMQAELLLIARDRAAIDKYLPKLERSAAFIESRRDPSNNLFLAGPAGNLLAPSYAGWKKADGTYDKAYLAGLSITYIAALDRLIELEKMVGRGEQAKRYAEQRELARKGLPLLTTDEGYFIKYLDPDGTRHGVYGAPKHGYFEAVSNHDAICFRVTDDAQSQRIYDKIASIPGLRPYDLIVTNYPALDDMYEAQNGIWKFGHWVNGGHWSTCEARMIMAYYRLGKYEDARRSMKKMLGYARRFRMDNPLVDFGNDVYQPHVPINCVYDNWGVPAGLIRGLFEYLYTADGVRIVPHIPPGIKSLRQHFPVRFGQRRLHISVSGQGRIAAVRVNGRALPSFTPDSVLLPDDEFVPRDAEIEIDLGTARPAAQPRPARPRADEVRYVDPAQLASIFQGNGLPVRIGADSDGKSRFVGQIRRVRIWSRALPPEQIAAPAGQGGGSAGTESLLVDLAGDALNGGQVRNKTADQFHAKVVGEVAQANSPEGHALLLEGKGYLEIADAPRLALNEGFTLDAWICPGQLPAGGGRIIDKCHVGTSDGYTFDTYPGNSLRLITPHGTVAHDARFAAGQWYHVTGTYDPAGQLRLYIDGSQVAAAPAQPRPVAPLERISKLHDALVRAGLEKSYEGLHARLVLDAAATAVQRQEMLQTGRLEPLADPVAQSAADRSYVDTVMRLGQGLQKVLDGYTDSQQSHHRRVHALWMATDRDAK